MEDRQTVVRTLPCELSDAELADRARQLAAAIHSLDALDAVKATWAASHNAKVKESRGRVADLADRLRTSSEYRPVECVVIHDDRRLCVETRRLDTNQLVDERPMDDEEREAVLQPTLPGVDAKPKKGRKRKGEEGELALDAPPQPGELPEDAPAPGPAAFEEAAPQQTSAPVLPMEGFKKARKKKAEANGADHGEASTDETGTEAKPF